MREPALGMSRRIPSKDQDAARVDETTHFAAPGGGTTESTPSGTESLRDPRPSALLGLSSGTRRLTGNELSLE